MCTVSWIHDPDHFVLCSNRDELNTRAPALPPVEREINGLRALLPVDADAGGTWIGVNERGLCLCLLNRYDKALDALPAPNALFASRGELIPYFLGAASADGVIDELLRWPAERIDLRRYRPFTLCVTDPLVPPLIVDWTGRRLRLESDGAARLPLVSSSADQAGAQASRSALWRALQPQTAGDLSAFHANHADGPSACSVCMHRADARTVSFTQVSVTARAVALSYQPGAPCEDRPVTTLTLPRTFR